MPTILQATNLSGQIIEAARWEPKGLAFIKEDHLVQINMDCKDKALLSYVARHRSNECSIDSSGTPKKSAQVIMTFRVGTVRHMLDAKTSVIDTMIMIVPANRLVEGVMMYTMFPEKCDPRFVDMIRQAGRSVISS